MRFIRKHRHPFTDTTRKRAALRRKQRLEREALPLFAEQIAAVQPTEDAVMAQRAVAAERWEQEFRDAHAARWREARRRLFEYSGNERAALRAAWDMAPYPGDPVYLLDFLFCYARGDFTLDALPFIPRLRNDRGHAVVAG